jgi:hypothetical protein
MTIIRTNNNENFENYFPLIQSDECNIFMFITGYNALSLRIMILQLRRIILLTNRIKDVTIS